MAETIAIGSGDRMEMRRPPTVVRKPPLTARITATTQVPPQIARKARLLKLDLVLPQ